ncbi:MULTISPECIES: sigma-70 family RNA polymerase sigma factor [unclassified Moraxella]|uniref:sigma-70 family RNA polymerase sigma factor n=1 Tax=unclassified Moraxella TaxID=2685852 RepID=UPI00359D4BC1
MNDEYQTFIKLLLKDNKTAHILHYSLNEQYLGGLYKELLKFAQNQLNDSGLAEDAVQECLLSAMQYAKNFKGNSAFKSWVFAILKHKITDCLRKNMPYTTLSDLGDGENQTQMADLVFSEAGRWHKDYMPTAFDDSWCDPELQMHNHHFWQVLSYCLNNLAGEQARVFLMKEYLALDSDEICQTVQISKQNYYVLMHRARLNLQTCLTRHWFDE